MFHEDEAEHDFEEEEHSAGGVGNGTKSQTQGAGDLPVLQESSTQIITHLDDTVYTGYLFPHALFVQELERLGFSMNDGIANLMPILMHCTDE